MKKNLLVVEDDSGLRRYFVILLEQMGYNVTASSNGAEALSLLLKENNFHLVVTDIDMPVMSGLEMLEELFKRDIRIPVCTVSGLNDDRLISKLEKIGCRDFLKKPVKAVELSEKIKTMLERDGSSASLESSC